jgi:mannitol/fructose-specific phosphotransferase system IIA component (Ntr-type)
MRLAELTRPALIFTDLPGSDVPTILRALADRVAAVGLVADVDELYDRLFEREQLGSTAIGAGVAIPHCKVEGLERVALAIGLPQREVDFAAEDGEPVRLFVLIVSPPQDPAAHLKALAAVSKWLKADDHVGRIVALDDPQAVYALLEEEGSGR